ncbi:hypothetical protein AMECASPLE_006490 [Ameca splendens]|uniref:Uncharacterized protein n=1 Tax=Ameca splendens TaxID=208324 RepID=A0ABV1A5Q0_9TELE
MTQRHSCFFSLLNIYHTIQFWVLGVKLKIYLSIILATTYNNHIILIVFRFMRDWVAGAADSAEKPRRPSPQTPPPGGVQGVPRLAERHSPSSVSWAVPWASSRWDVSGTPAEEGVQEASGIDARATSTDSSRCGSSGFTPSPSRMADLFTLFLRECPATLRKKLISAACIRDLVFLVMTQSSWPCHPSYEGGPPPQSASPEALFPTATQC